ncbi:MAG: hypothetical protein CM15mP32_3800 [Flavobacteriaceae bacterium]|nr:MAG: hypothetical protein CM15mP32_3800 [Flavobacteriaceae bacterium]
MKNSCDWIDCHCTPKVQEDILKNLGITDAVTFKASFNRPNLFYEVLPKTDQVDRDITSFIKRMKASQGLFIAYLENE